MGDKREDNLQIHRDISLLSSLSQSSVSSIDYPELRPFILSEQSCESALKYIDGDDQTTRSEEDGNDLTANAILEDAEVILEEIFEAGKLIKNELSEGIELLTKPEDFTSDYSWFDGILGVVSIVTFLSDFGTDIFLSSTMQDDPLAAYWSQATFLLALIPVLVQNLFSIYWYWFDERRKQAERRGREYKVRPIVWFIRTIFHMTLLAPVLRQFDIIYYGMKSTTAKRQKSSPFPLQGIPNVACSRYSGAEEKVEKLFKENDTGLSKDGSWCSHLNYRQLWLHAEGDSAALDFIGTLLQDAPQVVLQLFVMTRTFPSFTDQSEISHTMIVQLGSVSVSLVTMAWTISGFMRAVRLPSSGLRSLSPLETILLTFAHFTSITPQVASFALLASKQLILCLALVTLHWMVATCIIAFKFLWQRDTNVRRALFSHDLKSGSFAWLDDLAFSAAFGIAFLFTFIDVNGEAPLIHSVFFCCGKLVEEVIFLSIWYLTSSRGTWWHWFPLALLPAFFILSLLFFVLFYRRISNESANKKQRSAAL